MYEITGIQVGGGLMGLAPLPGRDGDFEADFRALVRWRPNMVLSLTRQREMRTHGAQGLGARLEQQRIGWAHYEIRNFGVPDAETGAGWRIMANGMKLRLAQGERILVHCLAGCGRTGMVVLRLMIETGETYDAALARLRAARPCAVETSAQARWAALGLSDDP